LADLQLQKLTFFNS